MDDDFNTPQALGVLFEIARVVNEDRERGDAAALATGAAELRRLGGALGLFMRRYPGAGPSPDVERLVAERTQARVRRDWRRSDELRAEIQGLGWLVEDTPGGPRLTRKSG